MDNNGNYGTKPPAISVLCSFCSLCSTLHSPSSYYLLFVHKMLKRMTERFNHSRNHHGHSLSSPQNLSAAATTASQAPLLPSSSSSSTSPALQSPAQSNVTSLTPSTGMSHSEYRGSMSTQRTSLTLPVVGAEWSKVNDSPEITEDIVRTHLTASQRPRGTYKLTDFIIHRTLGTGSFGRVHLGIISTPHIVILPAEY
jgi:hypothetical protein